MSRKAKISHRGRGGGIAARGRTQVAGSPLRERSLSFESLLETGGLIKTTLRGGSKMLKIRGRGRSRCKGDRRGDVQAGVQRGAGSARHKRPPRKRGHRGGRLTEAAM